LVCLVSGQHIALPLSELEHVTLPRMPEFRRGVDGGALPRNSGSCACKEMPVCVYRIAAVRQNEKVTLEVVQME
jgi:hypothetical protein